MLAGLCGATMVAYIDRGCISIAAAPIRADLGLDYVDIGLAMGAFFLSYTLFQLPAGWLAHVWGTRRALPLFSVLWSAATAFGALAHGLPLLLVSRLGLGGAEAGVFPCAASTIARWFPVTRRALMTGLMTAFMGVGAAVGAVLTGALLEVMNWRSVLLVYSVPGLAWAAWFYVWFRDRPEDHPGVNAAELDLIRGGPVLATPKADGPREPTPWGAILSRPAMWAINGQQFFKAAGYIFYLTWFPIYLQQTRGVNLVEAGVLTSVPHWALTVSPILGGWLSDTLLARAGSRRVARQGLSVAALIGCGLLVLAAYPIANAWQAVAVMSLGAFCAGLSGPCAYAITMDMGGKHVAPVFSIMNMSGNLGAVLFPVAVPWLVAETGNWDAVLFLFAGLYVAAGLCWLPFNPEGSIVPVAKETPRWDDEAVGRPWSYREAPVQAEIQEPKPPQ